MPPIPKITKLANLAVSIGELWKNWIDQTREKRFIWDQSLKHYGQTYIDKADYKDFPWRCTNTRPVAQEVGDTVSAAVKNSLFPANDDYFEVKGVDRTGKFFEGPVNAYLKRKLLLSRFVSKTEPFIKQVCLLGNGTAVISNERKFVNRKRWQDFNVESERIALIDYPVFQNQDIFSVAFDPSIESYDQSTTRIRRTVVKLDSLKFDNASRKAAGKNPLYMNLNKIKPTPSGALSDSTESNKQIRRSRYGINQGIRLKEGEVELLTLFGDIQIGSEVKTDHLVVVANREIIIRMQDIPFFSGNPHVFAKYSSFPGELFGRGVIEPIIGLQQLIDTFSCQKADLINLILGGFWAINPNELLDIENLNARPHGMIFMKDIDQIKSLLPSANPTLAFAEIEDLRNETERSSGASRFAQGVVAGGRRTATEALVVSQGTSNRFNDIITVIGEEAIEPALNIFLQQDFQFNAFQPDPFTGEEILPFDAWNGRYYVHFNGAKQSAIREITLQAMIQLVSVVGNSPVFAGALKPEGFLREFAQLMNIDPEKVINIQQTTPPPPANNFNQPPQQGVNPSPAQQAFDGVSNI